MGELLMNDVQQKFANARTLCPMMSEEIYALTDYLALMANDSLEPVGIPMTLVCVMDDIKNQRSGYGKEFPEYLVENGKKVREHMPYVLQVIDAIAEKDFAEEVRSECKKAFNWDIPRRTTGLGDVSEDMRVNIAVDWWTQVLLGTRVGGDGCTNLDELAEMLKNAGTEIGVEDVKAFRKKLAEGITQEMNDNDGWCSLMVDYHPDNILREAGKMLGRGEFGFPFKTSLTINPWEVSVSVGYAGPHQVIWKAS